MFINKEKPIFDTDTLLTGFTFRDLLDTTHANGDTLKDTFNLMLNECIENAKGYFEMYEQDLEEALQGG